VQIERRNRSDISRSLGALRSFDKIINA